MAQILPHLFQPRGDIHGEVQCPLCRPTGIDHGQWPVAERLGALHLCYTRGQIDAFDVRGRITLGHMM